MDKPKKRTIKYLTHEERLMIEKLYNEEKMNMNQIAKKLKRNSASIYRHIKINLVDGKYILPPENFIEISKKEAGRKASEKKAKELQKKLTDELKQQMIEEYISTDITIDKLIKKYKVPKAVFHEFYDKYVQAQLQELLPLDFSTKINLCKMFKMHNRTLLEVYENGARSPIKRPYKRRKKKDGEDKD